jgi:hypothetical protein
MTHTFFKTVTVNHTLLVVPPTSKLTVTVTGHDRNSSHFIVIIIMIVTVVVDEA